MPVRVISVVVFLVVVCGSLMIRFRDQSLIDPAKERGSATDISDIPKPATGAALPKAVVIGESLYDFGATVHGSKGEHTFKIRNDGNAPLELVARKQDHSCQCTLGSLGTNGLKPGEETTVTLSWEIKNPSTHFHHFAKVRTNDPDKSGQEISFRVRGLVVKRLSVRPGNEISIGSISENKPVVKTLTLVSELADSFQIQSVVASMPAITTISRPLSAEEIEKLNVPDRAADAREGRMPPEEMAKAGGPPASPPHDHAGHQHEDDDQKEFMSKRALVKSGYEVTVTLPTILVVGRFRETVTIQTDLEAQPIIVSFGGTRIGPVQILGTPGSGWNATSSLLHLGRFLAKDGKKAKLLIFVNKASEDLKIVSSQATPAAIKFQLIKDEKFNGVGREKFDLIVEVPAGTDPIAVGDQNPGSLVLETNHPDAEKIKLDLDFTSY